MIQIQNPKQERFDHLKLELGAYLEIGIWDLPACRRQGYWILFLRFF
jgi:hypothetical protein